MTELVRITRRDETFIQIHASPGVLMEISEQFSYMSPKAKWDIRYKRGLWDGRTKLLDRRSNSLYLGLHRRVKEFCAKYEYDFVDDADVAPQPAPTQQQFETFLRAVGLPADKAPRGYQIRAVIEAIRHQRLTLISPTASGKSLIIYLLARWWGRKTLVVVPTIGLVSQMAADFAEYGYTKPVSQIRAGQAKEQLHDITISTWQSIYQMPASWFEQFDVLVGDEAHTFAAPSLKEIMKKAHKTAIRYGTTGTADSDELNRLIVEGFFGPFLQVTTTKDLMEQGYVAKLAISALQLEYPEADRKEMRRLVAAAKKKTATEDDAFGYSDEIDFLRLHAGRNRFIVDLASRQTTNTIVLFRRVAHGELLRDMLMESNPDSDVHFVYGKTDADDRDEVRTLTEQSNCTIIVASYRTFGTGTNIRNLHNIIFAAPIKAKIAVIQAIGRTLRLHDTKDTAQLYDLGDDLSIGRYENFAWRHFKARLSYYIAEQFDHTIIRVPMS